MAAEVSSMVREVSGYKEEGQGSRDLVTRDLLGGGKILGRGDADAELQASVDWSGSDFHLKIGSDPAALRQQHDLNLPPPSSSVGGAVDESSSLDLSLSATPTSSYRSVCTLEKVKLALERAEREWCGGSPSSSTTSSSFKRRAEEDMDWTDVHNSPLPSMATGGMAAAGCPCCLLYVLVSTTDPRCPRCGSQVPIPAMRKKTRIDLNSSLFHH
ncbi:hypothetical protein HPP92_015701 [Vanilla planifolia]|uniref:GIR1-like zinc ribbon domain-containing protein n=1 Tax=Vanilla planifolia TaxID=51239 RepID=A0A835QDG8_VANPL|nr:hypothetical protein HPP92_015701 [Vanilla planifolia]